MREAPGDRQTEHAAQLGGAPTPAAIRRLSPPETGGNSSSVPVAVLRDGAGRSTAAPHVPAGGGGGQRSLGGAGVGAPPGSPAPNPAYTADEPMRPALGLYLHLPFCDHKCAYCD